jgi:hypothetical protein
MYQSGLTAARGYGLIIDARLQFARAVRGIYNGSRHFSWHTLRKIISPEACGLRL